VSQIPLPPLGLPFGKRRKYLVEQLPAIEAMLRPLGKDGGNGAWSHAPQTRKKLALLPPSSPAARCDEEEEPAQPVPPAPPSNEQLRAQASIESFRAMQQAVRVFGVRES
jgi:hypothetical protein